MPVRKLIVPDLSVINVSITLQQYAALYQYTDQSHLLDDLGYRGYVKATWEQRGICLNEKWLDAICKP